MDFLSRDNIVQNYVKTSFAKCIIRIAGFFVKSSLAMDHVKFLYDFPEPLPGVF